MRSIFFSMRLKIFNLILGLFLSPARYDYHMRAIGAGFFDNCFQLLSMGGSAFQTTCLFPKTHRVIILAPHIAITTHHVVTRLMLQLKQSAPASSSTLVTSLGSQSEGFKTGCLNMFYHCLLFLIVCRYYVSIMFILSLFWLDEDLSSIHILSIVSFHCFIICVPLMYHVGIIYLSFMYQSFIYHLLIIYASFMYHVLIMSSSFAHHLRIMCSSFTYHLCINYVSLVYHLCIIWFIICLSCVNHTWVLIQS